MSKQPHWDHQFVCGLIFALLQEWSRRTRRGVPNIAPGIIFADDDDAAPDVVWISHARLATALEEDGKLHAAPELVVEVVSPGDKNEHRDREAKLRLYSRQGVDEYWIVDWQARRLDVYRREPQAEALRHVATLGPDDTLESQLLPAFRVRVGQFFFPRPLR